MGAAGAGKTTVGRALAEALNWPFHDADDHHPPANVEKMRRGEALKDADRLPWLDRVADVIQAVLTADGSAVVACSALRKQYRTRLSRGSPDVRFVFLDASPDLLRTRLHQRSGHFATAVLLESQLAALEPPDGALTLDAREPIAALVGRIRTWLTSASTAADTDRRDRNGRPDPRSRR